MYQYTNERAKLFTDEGNRTFLGIRDHVHKLLKASGAVRMQEAISVASGETWFHLACVDRMVELGELVEITKAGTCPGQFRVFV